MMTSSATSVSPVRSRAVNASLMAGFVLAILVAGPKAQAQASPRGPEVVVDPAALGLSDCPLVVGRRNGEAGILWDRTAPGGASALSLWFSSPDSENGAIYTLADSADLSDFYSVSFTTVPGGYRVVWTRSTPSEFDNRFVASTADRYGRHPPIEKDLGRTGLWGVELSSRPHGGLVSHWRTPRGLAVQLLDDEGIPMGEPVAIRAGKLYQVSGTQVLHQTDGSFVVLFSMGFDADRRFHDLGLLGQRFDAQGRPIGRPYRLLPPLDWGFQFGTFALGPGDTLAVATGVSAGRGPEPRPTNSEVSLRVFTSAGVPLSPRIEITPPTRESLVEALAVDPEGRVLLIWSDATPEDGNQRFHAQVFDRTGARLGGEFVLGSAASAGNPLLFCAGADWAGDDWVVAWKAFDPSYASRKLFLRRFAREP